MSDEEGVRRANRAFYDAFESLDLETMERVWLPSERIRCTHPGWRRLAGRRAVLASWQRIFESTLAMRFQIEDEEVSLMGDLAWVVCVERIRSQTLDGASVSRVEATNVFERRDDRWLLVHHHGSPILAAPDDDGNDEPGGPLLQ